MHHRWASPEKGDEFITPLSPQCGGWDKGRGKDNNLFLEKGQTDL
jgi:hypothetical protein